MNTKSLLAAGAFCAGVLTQSWAQEVITPPDGSPKQRGCYIEGELYNPCPTSTSDGHNPQEYPQQMDTGRCNLNVCHITVKAVGPCKVSVSPEFTFISEGNTRVIWELKAAGNFAFDPVRGIEFKAEYNPAYREQFVAGQGIDAKTWQYIDANSQPGAFRYSINVYNTRTGQTCSYDPGVINDWPG